MPQCRLPQPKHQNNESGFLLVGLTVVLLVIIAMVSSFSFVVTRENRFQGNYAAGQRLAWLANAAHIYAQQTVYSTTPNGSVDNLNIYISGMNVPDNQTFAPIKNTDFSIEIIGKNLSPVAGATTFKHASAYLHLRVRPRNGQARLPNDTLALQAGAASANLSRIGFYKTNIDPADKCDTELADKIAVRWGPEDSSCLTDDQALMFTDLRPGDIIIPAWETALAKIDRNALLRYPQPERPSYNAMSSNLNMNVHDIVKINNASTEELNPTGGPMGTLIVKGNLDTVSKNPALPMTFNLNGPVITADKLTIAGKTPDGKGMTVSGEVKFNSNVSVADTLSHKEMPGLIVAVANNPPVPTDGSERQPSFYALNLGQETQSLLITRRPELPAPPPGDTNIALGTRFLSGNINNITLNNASVNNMRLAVAGTLNASAGTLRANDTKMDIYAARLITRGSVTMPTTGSWKIGAINQKNADNALTIDSLTANKCNGSGCPTAIIDLPDIE